MCTFSQLHTTKMHRGNHRCKRTARATAQALQHNKQLSKGSSAGQAGLLWRLVRAHELTRSVQGRSTLTRGFHARRQGRSDLMMAALKNSVLRDHLCWLWRMGNDSSDEVLAEAALLAEQVSSLLVIFLQSQSS